MAPNIHPNAIVDTDDIGDGTAIWAFAHVMKGASIGSDCKIGDHVFIEDGASIGDRVTVKNSSLLWHGVDLADDVFIGPNVVFTNDVRPRAHAQSSAEDWISTYVGVGASIGANSTIVAGIHIGDSAMVGAGSVVVADVPAYGLVYGNPAVRHGWVCWCGVGIDEETPTCSACGRSYTIEGSGDTTRLRPGDA